MACFVIRLRYVTHFILYILNFNSCFSLLHSPYEFLSQKPNKINIVVQCFQREMKLIHSLIQQLCPDFMCSSEEEVACSQYLLSRISPLSILGCGIQVPGTGTPFKCHESSAGVITLSWEDWVPWLLKLKVGAIWICGHSRSIPHRGDRMEKTRREMNMNRMQQKLFNGTHRAWEAGVEHVWK